MVAQDLGVEQRGAMGFDITKRDAISSLGACAHWIVSCVEPNERSLGPMRRGRTHLPK